MTQEVGSNIFACTVLGLMARYTESLGREETEPLSMSSSLPRSI